MRSARRWYWFWTSDHLALACSSSVGMVLMPHPDTSNPRATSSIGTRSVRAAVRNRIGNLPRIDAGRDSTAGYVMSACTRDKRAQTTTRPSDIGNRSGVGPWHGCPHDAPRLSDALILIGDVADDLPAAVGLPAEDVHAGLVR